MAHRFEVTYEIRNKDAKLFDYLKECEVEYFATELMECIEYPDGSSNRFSQEDLEWYDSYPKIKEIMNSDDSYGVKQHKIIEIIMSTDEWDNAIDGPEDVYRSFEDLNSKYYLLKRYFMAFKIALLKYRPHHSLLEEGNPKVLDQYLNWLDDIYKEINPKNKPPELSKEMMDDLNIGIEGYMGSAEYAFGTYETTNGVFEFSAHPFVRFEFKVSNEESFKSRIKDILLNKNIFYKYVWGLS
jgi:hypothetical protein